MLRGFFVDVVSKIGRGLRNLCNDLFPAKEKLVAKNGKNLIRKSDADYFEPAANAIVGWAFVIGLLTFCICMWD